jgi:high-affinity Fe2+/Pb2+ permease
MAIPAVAPSSFETYFSLVAFFIFLRETLEASVIIAVLLQCTSRTYPRLKRQVWAGAAAGILLSLAFGAIFAGVYYALKTNLFQGSAKAIFQGCISYIACILITWLGFAMLRFSNIEKKFERKLGAVARTAAARSAAAVAASKTDGEGVEGAAASSASLKLVNSESSKLALTCAPDTQKVVVGDDATEAGLAREAEADTEAEAAAAALAVAAKPKPSFAARMRAALCCCCPGSAATDDFDPNNPLSTRAHAMSVFVLAMTAVLREGIESVIFLAGVGSNAPPTSLPLACLAGLVVGLAVGAFIFYGGRSIRDLRIFFCISTFLLFLIAAGQVALGTLLLSSAGAFGKYSAWTDQLTWQFRPLSDWSKCCSESLNAPNKLFPFLKAIFGYTERPTPMITIMYCIYWAAVITALLYKYWNGSLFDADHKRHRKLHALGRAAARHRRRVLRLERREQGLRADLGLPLGNGSDGGSSVGGAGPNDSAEDVEGGVGAAGAASAAAAVAEVAAAALAGDKKAARFIKTQEELADARRASAEAESALTAEQDRLRTEDEEMAERRRVAFEASAAAKQQQQADVKGAAADAAEAAAGAVQAGATTQPLPPPKQQGGGKWLAKFGAKKQ